jgi:hypothetical protein
MVSGLERMREGAQIVKEEGGCMVLGVEGGVVKIFPTEGDVDLVLEARMGKGRLAMTYDARTGEILLKTRGKMQVVTGMNQRALYTFVGIGEDYVFRLETSISLSLWRPPQTIEAVYRRSNSGPEEREIFDQLYQRAQATGTIV